MKKLLLYLLFTCSFAVNAQIAAIPNAAFKDVLVNQEYIAKDSSGANIIIDANDDGEIQVSEALAVWELGFSNYSLGNLSGIETFKNLRILLCAGNQLTSLDVQELEHLEVLACDENDLVNLDLSNMSALREVTVSSNNLTNINILGLPNLQKLFVYNNHLTSLDYSGAPNLKLLDVGGGNNFTSFTVTGLNQLTTFTFDDMYEPATTVTIANLPSLTYLQMGYGMMETLELINLPALTYLQANNNSLTSLNLSTCPVLADVILYDNPLNYINAANGTGSVIDIIINYEEMANNITLCVDEQELGVYQELEDMYENVTVNTGCALAGSDFVVADFEIYPNPSNGIVNIVADNDIASVELYDLQGRQLQTVLKNGRETKLDLSQRAPGIYFIRIRTVQGYKVEKIIKY